MRNEFFEDGRLKFTAELRTEWSAALRSGKFEQGQYRLRRGGKFCCLGVLCEVLGVPSVADPDGKDCAAYGDENYYSAVFLPFQHTLPEYTLTEMNDGGAADDPATVFRRRTFAEIADYVDTLPTTD